MVPGKLVAHVEQPRGVSDELPAAPGRDEPAVLSAKEREVRQLLDAAYPLCHGLAGTPSLWAASVWEPVEATAST